MDTYRKHISHSEKAVAAIIWSFFLLTMVTHIFFGGKVLILAALFAVCGVVFSCLVFLPESYVLREDALVIEMLLRKPVTIPYGQILYIDTVGTFRSSKRDFDTVEVIVKYRPTGKKLTRSVSCHPRNVMGFVNTLKPKCLNLIPEE